MNSIILEYLKSLKKKTVSLDELTALFTGKTTYTEFASYIEELNGENILAPIKARGRNVKNPSLFYAYKVNTHLLHKDLIEEIQNLQLQLKNNISLSAYYRLNRESFKKDLPWIMKIDAFLSEKGFPVEEVCTPERSFQLVSDEKWIDQKGGKKLLERLKIWDDLKITSIPDPLMLYINPLVLREKVQKHLIIENKATFYAVSDMITKTSFATVVYGCGWKIAGSMHTLPKQLSLEDRVHKYYYFGDLDYEGLSIWAHVKESVNAIPAVPFYEALLQTSCAYGKTTQRKNEKALQLFSSFFDEEYRMKINNTLESGGYYPQETLSKEVLHKIWRTASWK